MNKMCEDEKKAIEHLNKIKSYGMIMGLKADGDIDIVLNLIEKQQNELQQEKEKNNKIQKYVRSNEWAKDYEKSSCRTKILRILEE